MDLYKDPIYLKSLLGEMDDCIGQLQKWSVYNTDIIADHLALFATLFDNIKMDIEGYQKDVMAEAESYIESGAGE